MARKKKVFNKDGIFQVRFRDLCYKSGKTQEQLANILEVSRPTVSGWLDGKNIPDIISLTRIAEYFEVSADYLLGLSNTVSPDINVKAAVAYTGLSEAAVEWLHIGLDDFECDGGLSEEAKRENLEMASALIQDRSFTRIIHHLKQVSLEAYLEKILWILDSEYSECASAEEDSDFIYAHKEDRDVVAANLLHVFETKRLWDKESIRERVASMNDDALSGDVISEFISAKKNNELHQFHAAKALTAYIDRLVEHSHQRAEQRFKH